MFYTETFLAYNRSLFFFKKYFFLFAVYLLFSFDT